ncbi:ankyrin repeat-containing protein [Stemphylium lycopersici]|nr:ankyrin repeat-containing protein [Stemphylium lycopersici]
MPRNKIFGTKMIDSANATRHSRKLVDKDFQNGSVYTVCYFFFKDNENQNSLPNALCSILHQLFASQPGLIKHALNPPEEGCLKILATSRPYDEIRDGFENIPSSLPTIHLRGDEMNDRIHEEIDFVVRARFVELTQRLKLAEKTKQKLEEKLLGMEHRTYLWLYFAIKGIQTVYADSLRPEEESVDSLSSSVEDAYEKILARVTSKQEEDAKKILQIIVGARRPLTTGELAKALNIAMEPDRLREKIRRLCGLFIFFNNSRAYLINQTAKEYLVGKSSAKSSRWKHCFSPTEPERLMAQICINYLVPNDPEDGGDGNIIDSALVARVGKLCDIGDGSGCAWLRVYSDNPNLCWDSSVLQGSSSISTLPQSMTLKTL